MEEEKRENLKGDECGAAGWGPGRMGAVAEWLTQCRESRKLILVIVAIALLLDKHAPHHCRYVKVPIIPKYLYQLHHPNFSSTFPPQLDTTTTTTTTVAPLPPFTSLNDQSGPGRTTSTMEFLTNSTPPKPPPTPQDIHKMNHEDLVNENVEVGLLFCSKAVVQLLTNPFIGPLTHR
ncbi:hypothetical protein Pmani_028197 [Petrolisthes manimaculis]|uniref:Uncharacterized protein n=1 Tax=Petrolisthes manimaculis TaxID=1843537 RepID=A0AAE1P2M2_9EUCA|nr:hypothetical protein Pmani_028197 [Petrolisthes manimaculis]